MPYCILPDYIIPYYIPYDNIPYYTIPYHTALDFLGFRAHTASGADGLQPAQEGRRGWFGQLEEAAPHRAQDPLMKE